jgi:asparagine N-glycosylation enzyme membrane subunit Stt3
VVLIILYIKNRGKDKPILLFFIWTLVMLIATLVQRRFAYYFVVNMAVLSAYLCWQGIWWFSKRRNHLENPETLREQYKRSTLVGILGGALLFGWSFILTKTMYLFVPIFILGLLSVFYGFWAWVRLKNKNEYMILWAFVFPLGALVLAGSKNEAVKNYSTKKTRELPKEKTKPWLYAVNIITLVLVVFMAVGWPNYDKARGVAAAATYAPSNGWEETLHWMRNNTPDPMPAGSYNALYPTPSNGAFSYPDTAYGVTAWWDYGYWITRTAHRIPNANPSQEPGPIQIVANLFLAQDQQTERDIVKKLDSSYIVLDDTMTTSKIWAVMTWAGKNSSDYSSIFYYKGQGNQVVPIQVYDLAYYKLLSVRLFNFNGKESKSERPMVITWTDQTSSTGVKFRLVTDAQEYDSYQSALNYVAANPDKKLYIAGSSPFVNPIHIDAVTDYNLIFGSTEQLKVTDNTTMSTVKVFQYVGPK